MILTYSNPRFKDLILSGEKIHTIREDKNRRWKTGMSIQHWMGNPRNVSKNPYCFGEGVCRLVQNVWIVRTRLIMGRLGPLTSGLIVQIEGRLLHEPEVEQLAKNDGLTVAEFRQWFVPEESPVFIGRIIHFTDKIY